MITYVNTVLVGQGKGVYTGTMKALADNSTKASAIANAGKFIVNSIDDSKFRIGLITNKTTEAYVDGTHTYSPIVRWSNEIKKNDIKGMTVTKYEDNQDSEETVVIDFSGVSNLAELAKGNKRVILKLTFKDLPTRFRKWTESYEYVTAENDGAAEIATGLKNAIMRNYKRARIDAKIGTVGENKVFTENENGTSIQLVALPYDDDETVDSISPVNKVRFSASMWYTDPQAKGFASKNKYSLAGATITKTPGRQSVGNWKVVRDAESQAMGYMGILNRGECTWPIIKPDMNVQILPKEIDSVMVNGYDAITLEFENMYRTADDLFRKTKQTVEIFCLPSETPTIVNAINGKVKENSLDNIKYNVINENVAEA